MLKLRFKNNKLNAVWLVEPKVSIGRSPKRDLVINLPEIAEHHADILVKHEHLTLVNVSGSPQLSVNGRPVGESAPLKVNDEVSFGATVLQIIDPKTEIQARKPKGEKAAHAGTGWALKSNHSALSNRVFPIKGETVIGRSNDCDITIAAAHLSRRHVKLMVQDGLLFVKDLGSANGTYVNGERVTEARVKRGDELRFDTLSFGVIGPVEDMDKTTIRKVEPALAGGEGSKQVGSHKRPRKPGDGVRDARGGSAAVAASDINSAVGSSDSLQPSKKGKSAVLVIGLVVIAIGAALAYTQGLFDSFLK